jgi:tetratricopeptide (TPR) repeat protein
LFELIAEAAINYFQKGEQYVKDKNFKTGLSFLKLALQNDPFHLEARKLVAQCLFELKDYEESFHQWIIASRLDPQDPQILVNTAITLIEWKDPDHLKFGTT